MRLERENRNLRSQALRAHEILGDSAAVRKLKEQIAVAAPTNGWVLIHGENGTGLGLAIVSRIVADHHGYVRVQDNPPRGTRFVIELPVARAEAPRVVPARAEAGR